MSILNRYATPLESEDDKAYCLGCLADELSGEVLAGNYTRISLDGLQERLADSDLFWSALERLAVGHTSNADDMGKRLGALMGVIQGLAYDLALDKAPEVVQTDKVDL